MNPQAALKSLREYHARLDKLGGELVEKKKTYALQEAVLIDAENFARIKYFANKPCKLSELRDWIKAETAIEYAAERTAYNQMRTTETEFNILIECLNCLKASIKITELEVKNLSYQPQ